MAINKVIYSGNTLIDLTGDTVAPDALAEGVTAHNAKGEPITGTMVAGGGDPTLPDGYVRCGYIQFDGKQIVDTDIICN